MLTKLVSFLVEKLRLSVVNWNKYCLTLKHRGIIMTNFWGENSWNIIGKLLNESLFDKQWQYFKIVCVQCYMKRTIRSSNLAETHRDSQKLSKCEVKAWLCWYLIIIQSLRFCVKSNFGKFIQSKNVIFGNFRDSELGILVNLGLESCSNLLKIKIQNL